MNQSVELLAPAGNLKTYNMRSLMAQMQCMQGNHAIA